VILGLVEHDGAEVSALSLEMLTFGRWLAGATGTPLHAVMVGGAARVLAERLPPYGVSTVHLVADERLRNYAPAAWAQGLIAGMREARAQAVLAAGSDRGNEILAHVAAKTGLPMATNCVEVQVGEPYVVMRQRWGGSLLEEAELKGTPKLLTVAPHAITAGPGSAAGELVIRDLRPELSEKDLRVRVTGRVEAARGGVSLADARVVVSGGRGVGSAEGFRILEELAATLGGAVGCSRVVTSQGWRPHTDQVGQTGTRIAPDLYIACGVSGAIQHMVGCKSAKRILAINTDAEAPIFAAAHHAVIGDLHRVVPAMIQEIRRRKGQAGCGDGRAGPS
jgi:electron transfer flavoprotein alpha subunit